MILAIISLILGIAAYSISQLQQHGKLKNRNDINDKGFWGINSWTRKYKDWPKYFEDKPAFPGSTTFLVFLTDGYHLMQAVAMLCLSLSFGFLMGNHWYSAGAYILVHTVHFTFYRLLSKPK